MKYKYISKRFLTAISIFIVISLGILIYLSNSPHLFWKNAPEITYIPKNNYSETLRVVADYNYAPYSFFSEDNKVTGHDIELIYMIGDNMGKNIDIQLLPWNEAKNAILTGKADVLMGIEYNPDDLPEFALTIPLVHDNFVAFGKEKLEKTSQLFGKKLATIEESGSKKSFLDPYNLTQNTTFYPTHEKALQSVIDGENDFLIARYFVGRRALSQFANHNLQTSTLVLLSGDLAMAVEKSNTKLQEELNTALFNVIEDGSYDAVADKWLGYYVEVINFWDFITVNFKFFIGILGIFITATVLIYLQINRSLIKTSLFQKEHLSRILEYQNLLAEATKGLYENIYEFDITHNLLIGENTMHYFESAGVAPGLSYEGSIRTLAELQIKKEFIQVYLNIFLPENVITAYKKGITSLQADIMIAQDRENYYWIRIIARLFYWNSDKTLRMISYRQNIDAEKRHEMILLDKIQRDSMTGLYNKKATEDLINELLSCAYPKQNTHAFMIIDIDKFKAVNDTYGHAIGDNVIQEFVKTLKKHFRATDIIGRLGGDEFGVFISNIPNKEWVERQAQTLICNLNRTIEYENISFKVSGSLGIALFPEGGINFESLYKNADSALYLTKQRGRNGYTMYENDFLQDAVFKNEFYI